MQRDGDDVVLVQLRQAADLRVPETVAGEARLEHRVLAAVADQGVGRGRGPQIGGVQALLLVQGLAVSYDDARAVGEGSGAQPYAAVEVLAEVDDVGVGGDPGDRARSQRGRGAHRFVDGGHQEVVIGLLPDEGGCPAAVVEGGQIPAGGGAAEVVALAHEEIRVADLAGVAAPGAVGGDDLGGAVGAGEVEFGEEFGGGAVVGAGAPRLEADEAAPPAVGEGRAEHVLPVADEVGDVVSLVLDTVVVVGPAGSELGVADPFAVEPHLVQAARADVQPRPRDSTSREGAPQAGAGRESVAVECADPLGGRVHDLHRPRVVRDPGGPPGAAVGERGLEPGPGPCGRLRQARPHLDLPEVAGTGCDPEPLAEHSDRLGILDAAGVPEGAATVVEIFGAQRDPDPVGDWIVAAVPGGEPPREQRGRLIDSQRSGTVIASQGVGSENSCVRCRGTGHEHVLPSRRKCEI